MDLVENQFEKFQYRRHVSRIAIRRSCPNSAISRSKTKQIATLEVDGSLISDSNSIAESMNNFFCSIGNALSGKIPETANPLLENEYTVNSQNLRFELKAINMCQLEKIFNTFKKSKGSGADGIANYFLKIGLPAVIESLCDIFNLSIATGIFPDS